MRRGTRYTGFGRCSSRPGQLAPGFLTPALAERVHAARTDGVQVTVDVARLGDAVLRETAWRLRETAWRLLDAALIGLAAGDGVTLKVQPPAEESPALLVLHVRGQQPGRAGAASRPICDQVVTISISVAGVHPQEGGSRRARSSDTCLVDSSERRLLAASRPIPRSEMLAQAAAERVIELVVSALDVNAVLDQVDLNAVLDRIDLTGLLERIDVNDIVKRIDVEALVEQTDLGAVIASSSSSIASDVLDVVRSQTVGLDEFIARWVGRLRRRPYTGPPGPRPRTGP